MINLVVKPDISPISWRNFLVETEPNAVALDGYVADGPRYSHLKRGVYVNFNHHENVDRLATRATCAQVLLALRQRLLEPFRTESGEVNMNVYVNDCDQDVCLSWYLLNNAHIVSGTMNPLINRLVYVEDMLDATAGAYPFPKDLPLLEEIAWIFEPYTLFRLSGGLDMRNGNGYRSIITDVEQRIKQHVTGSGGSCKLDMSYEIIEQGQGWVAVTEKGAQAKTGMFADGHQTYLSVRERSDGNCVYVIGRMSQFVPTPLDKICEKLNELEGRNNSDDRWGGSNTIIGSPRVSGSSLKRKDVLDVITSYI